MTIVPINFSKLPDRRSHPSAASRAGFTLIELVLALAISAAIAASLYASMRAVFTAKASAEAAVEPARTAELAMEFMRNDLQNAMLSTQAVASNQALASSFEGTSGSPDDLIFFTTADSLNHPNANGEIKQVELTVATQNGDRVLLRRCIRNLLSQIQATPDEEVLCRGVTGLHFQYYTGQEWVDSWDSTQEQNLMPSAVQVTLELERPGAGRQMQKIRFARVFPISCSTVSAANPASGLGGLP